MNVATVPDLWAAGTDCHSIWKSFFFVNYQNRTNGTNSLFSFFFAITLNFLGLEHAKRDKIVWKFLKRRSLGKNEFSNGKKCFLMLHGLGFHVLRSDEYNIRLNKYVFVVICYIKKKKFRVINRKWNTVSTETDSSHVFLFFSQ